MGCHHSSPLIEGSGEIVSTNYKYVIIGGGNSAGYLAQSLCSRNMLGDEKTLAIISEEEALPYERPALSKGFMNKESPARLPGFHTCVGGGKDRQNKEWYEENKVDVFAGVRAVKIDASHNIVVLSTGENIGYEKLICATGLQARMLDLKARNENDVHYVSNVKNATVFYEAMMAEHTKNSLVIGGGFIGTEIAGKLITNGVNTTILTRGKFLMDKLFTEDLAQTYRAAFEEHGATVYTETSVDELMYDENDKLTGAKLSNGETVACDHVVVGIGAFADLSLYEGVVDCDGTGIIVNGQLQSSNPDIFAMGDIARFPLVCANNNVMNQPFVTNARQSADHLGSVFEAMKENAQLPTFEYQPFFYSRYLDQSWDCAGLPSRGTVALSITEGKKYGAVWADENNTIVAILLGNGTPEKIAEAKKIVTEGTTVFDKEAIVHQFFPSENA